MSNNVKTRGILAGAVVAAALLFGNTSSMAHSWVAPQEAAKIANPVAPTPSSIDNGREPFLRFCARCHGLDAKGLPAAKTRLKHDTPDLLQRLTQHSDGDFHWKTKNGKDEMPSFADDLSDADIWDLINYLKSLK
jgi:mono/diheme cytochrome c family protein